MSNMKYPPVEHVRHINLTKADLSARIFIVGYLSVELKGKKLCYTTVYLTKFANITIAFRSQI